MSPFVGTSNRLSLPAPAVTLILFAVKSLLFALSSAIVVVLVASEKDKWNPFVPYVPLKDAACQTPLLSYAPNDVGSSAEPSIK